MRGRAVPARTSGMGTLAALVLGLLLAGVGTGLWAAGVWPFERRPSPTSHVGETAIPIPIRAVQAYQPITRADLTNPETGQIHVMWIPEAAYKPSMMRDLGDIMGRVLAKDKTAGNVFQETDFLPKGTRPGITAGVPQGKRAITIPVSRIEGIELLYRGDKFDVLAVLPEKSDRPSSNVEFAALMGGIKAPDSRAGQLARQTGVKVLVHAGVMVAMTQGADQSTRGASELNGLVVTPPNRRGPAPPVVQATIAVDPEEVTPVTEALATDLRIYCIARSGHADDVAEDDPRQRLLEGRRPVVAALRSIAPYKAITQDDLADAVTGKLNLYYFETERVSSDWIVEFPTLIGRVVAHEIAPGHIFTENDLLPAGTPAGLSAAAPPGMVVVSLPADSIAGLSSLQPGERFQVLARLPDGLQAEIPQAESAALLGGRLADDAALVEDELRTGLRVLVRGGQLMLHNRDEGKTAVAVSPDEIKAFLQSVQRHEELQAVIVHAAPKVNPASVEDVATVGRDAADLVRPTSYQQAAAAKEIRVPVLTRNVAAHEPLRLADFVDSRSGRFREYLFAPELVDPEWELNIRQLVGRVTRAPLTVGSPVSRTELLPPGTAPGATASLPPGYMGFPTSSREISGLGGLRRGDRVALLVAHDHGDLGHRSTQSGLSHGDFRDQQARVRSVDLLANVTPVSVQAILAEFEEPRMQEVRETHFRVIEQQGYSLGPQGTLVPPQTRTEPVSEVYTATVQNFLLALDPADAVLLQEAIATGARVQAVALSGAPGELPPDRQLLTNRINGARPLIREHLRGTTRTRDLWLTAPATSP